MRNRGGKADDVVKPGVTRRAVLRDGALSLGLLGVVGARGSWAEVAAQSAPFVRIGLSLGALKRDSPVNLERALAAADRLGGHFVQGHIDCTARIVAFEKSDSRLEIALPHEGGRYTAEKGSIAVNGISLTIAEVKPASFVAWIIPHTRRYTNLKTAQPGELVNLEFDILAKYV